MRGGGMRWWMTLGGLFGAIEVTSAILLTPRIGSATCAGLCGVGSIILEFTKPDTYRNRNPAALHVQHTSTCSSLAMHWSFWNVCDECDNSIAFRRYYNWKTAGQLLWSLLQDTAGAFGYPQRSPTVLRVVSVGVTYLGTLLASGPSSGHAAAHKRPQETV